MTEPSAGPKIDWGAGHYERTAQQLLPAAQVLVDAAGVRRGERVLDVGCGTGNVALLAAAAGAQVIAVDPSARLLEVTRAAGEQSGFDVVCRTGEAENLPADDDSVDCLLSNFAVIFAPDPDMAAAEMVRVLAPGGRLLLTAWVPGSAMGEVTAVAPELIREATGAPPEPPRFGWHEEGAVQKVFSPFGLHARIAARHELAFTAASPEAYLEQEILTHPLAISGSAVLEKFGLAEEVGRRVLKLLIDRNEAPDAFRFTSEYVVVEAR